MRRSARAYYVGVTLLCAACSRNGLNLAVSNRPSDPALLLSCARSVATSQGLGEITESTERLELQAKSTVTVPGEQGAASSYDELTVKLSPAKRGLNMLVGGASYALRQLRVGAGGNIGASAAKTEWVGTSPSSRVALARDAILTQCGSLGS